MRICFAVLKDEKMGSRVYNHFGSAPMFIVVNVETKDVSTINNSDQHHAHGSCNPLKALDGQKVDAIVVGGIGAGALTRLNQSGIRVYRAHSGSVRENLALFEAQKLGELSLNQCCGGHSDEGTCSH
jgi:predicted Fe-Mo cluster-binding NifX family protein